MVSRSRPNGFSRPVGLLRAGLLLCLLLLLASFQVPPKSQAQLAHAGSYQAQSKWLTPVNLSRTPGRSNHPRMVVDHTGRLHVVWSEDTRTPPGTPSEAAFRRGDSIWYTQWTGSEWTPPNDIVTVQGLNDTVHLPVIAMDSRDNLHLVWVGANQDYSGFVYYSRCPAGHDPMLSFSWTSPADLAQTEQWHVVGGSYWPEVAVDRSDVIHVVWSAQSSRVETHDKNGFFPSKILYVQSEDGGQTWSEVTVLSDMIEGVPPSEDSDIPKIAFDENSGVHVFWNQTSSDPASPYAPYGGYGVFQVVSHDGGRSWSQASLLLDARTLGVQAFTTQPVVLFDADNTEHLLYSIPGGSSQIIDRQFRDQAAMREAYIKAGGSVQSYALWLNGAMAAGRLHLVWMYPAGASDPKVAPYQVFYASWNDGSWSEPQQISNIPLGFTNATGWETLRPKIAVGLGNQLHVVWHSWDEISRSWDIYYTHDGSDFPLLTPRPPVLTRQPIRNGSPIPTLSSSLAETSRFTPTPAAVSAISLGVPHAAVTTDTGSSRPLLYPVLAVVGILSLTMVVVRRRSR